MREVREEIGCLDGTKGKEESVVELALWGSSKCREVEMRASQLKARLSRGLFLSLKKADTTGVCQTDELQCEGKACNVPGQAWRWVVRWKMQRCSNAVAVALFRPLDFWVWRLTLVVGVSSRVEAPWGCDLPAVCWFAGWSLLPLSPKAPPHRTVMCSVSPDRPLRQVRFLRHNSTRHASGTSSTGRFVPQKSVTVAN